MAAKKTKTQAEKAAAQGKKNSQKSRSSGSATGNKKNESPKSRRVPVRFITSIAFLFSFVLFLIVFFLPEGAIVTVIGDFFHGLIGRVGFIVAIPALCVQLLSLLL